MFTNPPSLSMLAMIWASIYSLAAASAAASDRSIRDLGGWNPSLEVSGSGDLIGEGGRLAAGFLDSLESGHDDSSTSPGSSDQEYVAHERNIPCSNPKMMRRDPQSCIILPAPGNTNTRGSVGNPPGNNEGSGEHQDPSDDGIFKPLPGEHFFPNVIDWGSTNQHGWKICPRAKGDNKPLTAVCDSGRREDIVSSGIGWALSNVVPYAVLSGCETPRGVWCCMIYSHAVRYKPEDKPMNSGSFCFPIDEVPSYLINPF